MLKGERLDRPTYSFLHTLDEGNTGVCVLAQHGIFNCRVVQKLTSMLGMKDAAAASEPEILKRIRHPHIVEVWEAQWEPDPQWESLDMITFTTPYYEGGSIYTALSAGHRFGVGDTMRVAAHLLGALDHMHGGYGLLHRDVKPANVMLSADRRDAFLGDLGSAAYIQTATGGADAHAGSPLYLAPEARRSGVVTVKSDIYSLGLTLVEMLSGRFPYETLDRTAIDDRLAAGKRSLPDLYLAPAPWVPKKFATFLRSLTNVDPVKRPASAADALCKLNSLRVVDWTRSAGSGLTGTWAGSWPPDKPRGERRIHEVTVELVERGKDKGKLRAMARWRDPNGKWRNYARLTKLLDADSSGLAGYFHTVDAAAQAAPTR